MNLWSKFKIVTFVEGLKLYHIQKSYDHATESICGSSVLSENDFFDTSDPYVTHKLDKEVTMDNFECLSKVNMLTLLILPFEVFCGLTFLWPLTP